MRLGFDDCDVEVAHWVRCLEEARGRIPVSVLDRLHELGGEDRVARLLRSGEAEVRERAASALWVLWYRAAGREAETELTAAIAALEEKDPDRAVEILDGMVERYPDFAEAWNKRATAHYLAGRFDDAIRDCRETVQRNPLHYAAWHGLGLSLLRLDRSHEALAAFHRALALHPHEEGNRRAVDFCRDQIATDES